MDNDCEDGARILRGLRFESELGRGGTATAFKFLRDPIVVLKEAKHIAISGYENEARVLGHVLPLHRGIIYLFDYEPEVSSGNHHRYARLLLEYCDGGDLVGALEQQKDYLPEAFIWHVFLRLAEAIAHMHNGWSSKNERTTTPWEAVIHRDLKPDNIFLKQRVGNYPDVVVGDFGHAAVRSADGFIKPYGYGTPEYEPPERPWMDEKGDVWALGSIVHAMVFNDDRTMGPIRVPPGYSERTAAEQLNESRYLRSPRQQDGHYYSRRLYYWLAKCLSYDPHDRPTVLELVKEMVPEARRYRDTHYEAL